LSPQPSTFFPIRRLPPRLQQEPVGQNDGGGELIARKNDQKFPDDQSPGDGESEAHEKEGEKEGKTRHRLPKKLYRAGGIYTSVR